MIPGIVAGYPVAISPPGTAWYDLVFLPSDAGMAFDFNKLPSLYQNTSGTVPVTTVGDPIAAIRCQITGALAVIQGSYACSLGYDATFDRYYGSVDSATSGNSPLFRATGSLPSSLLGDTPFSLVAVAEWSATALFRAAYFGAEIPSNGNAGAIGHSSAPVLAFLQFGPGRGTETTAPISGVKSAIGTKDVRIGGGTAPSAVYVDGVSQTTTSSMTSSVVNVTVQDFDIARGATTSHKIYTVGVIDRALSALEAVAVHEAALPS